MQLEIEQLEIYAMSNLLDSYISSNHKTIGCHFGGVQ